MADDERGRILGLLEAGRITAEQAAVLLDAVAGRAGPPPPPSATPPRPPGAPGAPRARPPAQVLRISIEAHEEGEEKSRVHVNVPLKLARFASRFLPREARAELEAQGIDLSELLEGIGDEVPEGPLVDIDAGDDTGEKAARIRIEVV